MKIYKLDQKCNKTEIKIEEMADGIKKGKIAIFPTETVYGIGTNAFDEIACKKIYEAKKRTEKKPLIVLISSFNMLNEIVESINEIEYQLINKFWPGPLTIIMKRKNSKIISDVITAGKEYIGIRMTSSNIMKELIEKSGVPIVAPSANLSGKPTGINPEEILEDFKGYMDYIIDDGVVKSDITSTVIKVEDNKIHILREGKITKEQLQEITEIKN